MGCGCKKGQVAQPTQTTTTTQTTQTVQVPTVQPTPAPASGN